jgi:hypothetical protein
MKLILFLLLIVLLLPGCGESTLTKSDRIIRDVRATLESYHKDVRRSGLKAEFDYLDNSDHFSWTPPGYTFSIPYDSVATILNQDAEKYTSIDNSFDTLRITPLSEEYASYTGRLSSRITDTSGFTAVVSLVETGLMIKRPDGWKLLNGHTSILTK